MGFIFLLFIGFIILIICLSKKTNEELKHYGPVYYDYDDIEDDIMFHEIMDEENIEDSDNSSFSYPDPYDLNPADTFYVGEDGDILEDL